MKSAKESDVLASCPAYRRQLYPPIGPPPAGPTRPLTLVGLSSSISWQDGFRAAVHGREGGRRMDDEEARRARIAANEATFRSVNEKIETLNESFGPLAESMVAICECGDANCVEQITVSTALYE